MDTSTWRKGCNVVKLRLTRPFYFAVNFFGGRPTQPRVDLGAILGGLAQTVASQGQNGPQIQGGAKFNIAELNALHYKLR